MILISPELLRELEQAETELAPKERISIKKRPGSVKAKLCGNRIKVCWNKVEKKSLLSRINALQVQYSTSPNFRENTGTKKPGKKKTTVTLKLSKGKTWYIRVRFVGSNGVSKWSDTKRVRVK